MDTIKVMVLVLIIITVLIVIINIPRHTLHTVSDSHAREGARLTTPVESKALVVARYGEGLEWLQEEDTHDTKVYVYNKGKNIIVDSRFVYTRLDNVGVCDHTYLHHIITHYDNLEDVTIFLPASWQAKRKISCKDQVFKSAHIYHSYFTAIGIDPKLYNFTLNYYEVEDPRNRDISNFNLTPCSIRPYGKWYEHVTGNPLTNNISNYGCIFSLSKETIRKYPVSFYQNLISYLDKERFPEAAHYMERLWYNIFRLNKYKLALMMIVKNEAMVIEEFFKHYLWQGVEHFYVIDNGSTDSTKDIISKYPTTYYFLDKKYQQVKHYNHVYSEIRNECKWLIVCDCDEYIYNRKKGETIIDYLDTLDYNKNSNVELNWKMFGSSGHDKQPDNIRESFIHRRIQLDVYTKQILNTSLTVFIDVHNSRYTRKLTISNPQQLALNHYAIMSREYFSKVKMTRGDVNNQKAENVRDWTYFDKYDHKEIKDTELKELVVY